MTFQSSLGAAFAALVLSALGASAVFAEGPVVHTESGPVAGRSLDHATVFLGLPYAAAPVGPRRWRDPQQLQSWSDLRDAKTFAPACPQTGVSIPGEPPSTLSEDCLYLNVWTPDVQASHDLPVIVWFPGGGFVNGSTAIPLYDGLALARRGAVIVTVAYRLGALGFLAHPSLSAESPEHSSGNYGLMDQIAALEWVHRNIEAFGGDPDRVTIAGQSAGATSVSILMASPRAAGLFQRAIGQSGGLFEPVELAPRYLLANAEVEGSAWARSLGASTADELRALSVSQVLAAGDGVVHPVIEPRMLPRPPFDAFLTGHYNDVPLLTGYNAEEARSLADVSGVTAANFNETLSARWGELPAPLIAAYPFRTDEEARLARLNFERDLRFGWDVRTWAGLQAAHGRSPVFAYYFARKPPAASGSVQESWGASHFAELGYMFGHLSLENWAWTAGDQTLSDAMVNYWIRFARNGDPNGDDAQAWPAFTTDHPQVQILNEDIRSGVLPETEGLDVFDAVYQSIRQPPS